MSSGTQDYLPSNPTPCGSVSGKYYGQPRTIDYGDSITITPSNSKLYDCTSWDWFYSAPSYDYVGYFKSSYTEVPTTVTVLADKSAATQSLAFDIEEVNDSENWEV